MPAEVVLAALRETWRALEPLGKPMAVMGGLALAAWKCVRATRDVDLLVGVSSQDLPQILPPLQAVGMRPKGCRSAIRLGDLEVFQLLYEPPETFVDLQIDLLLGDSSYHQEALRRRIPMQLSGLDVTLDVLACEDLLLHKLLAGRIIDRVDAAALIRANLAALDRPYLNQWAQQLKLVADLDAVWEAAFPVAPPRS